MVNVVEEKRSAEVEESGQLVNPRNVGNNVRASWPFSLHTIRTNIAHCDPLGREALVSAFLWCTDDKHPIDMDTFAHRIGYAKNTLYKIYTGKYKDAASGQKLDVPEKLTIAIKHFLALERERFLGGRNEFVLTPTAQRVFNGCDLARESRSPLFLSGPSHIGKTWALMQYAQDNNHGRTVYVRMKAASGLGGMVRRMCERLGVSPNSCTANLVDRVKTALTPDMLIQIDEVHLLQYTYRKQSFFACMEVIREILDEVGCGAVFSGTLLMLDKLKEGEHAEMEQLLRRGVHRVRLPNMPSKGDLQAIFKHWHIDFPTRGLVVNCAGVQDKPYEVVRQVAKQQGLKAIVERLRYGAKLAARAKTKLTWEHVVEAHLSIISEAEVEADWN